MARPRSGPPDDHRLSRGRRGLPDLDKRNRPVARSRSPRGRKREFLAGRHPSQGPDGVCGPCSEIYYHMPGSPKSVEIWNLVFTQFNRRRQAPEQPAAFAEKEHRHGDGPGAHGIGPAGGAEQFRDRYFASPLSGISRCGRNCVRFRGSERPAHPPHCRPRSGHHLLDSRGRFAG